MALRDWLWIILLGAIWGSSFLFNDILVQQLGPLWVSAGRVGTGALGSWAFFFIFRKRLPRGWRIYGQLFVLGLLNYAIPFALFPLAQEHMASGVTAIVNAMTPISTVIVSQFWPGGEKATWNKSFGVLAGFSGIAILALPALGQGGSSELWAIGAAFSATVCYAFALNYARSLAKIDASVIAAIALTGATLAAAPMAFLVHGAPHMLNLTGWAALLGSGLLATAFAFQIMYRLLPRIGATNFTVTTFLAPISAIILGVSFLGETILPTHVLGMTGIFLGLILIDGRLWRRLRPARV